MPLFRAAGQSLVSICPMVVFIAMNVAPSLTQLRALSVSCLVVFSLRFCSSVLMTAFNSTPFSRRETNTCHGVEQPVPCSRFSFCSDGQCECPKDRCEFQTDVVSTNAFGGSPAQPCLASFISFFDFVVYLFLVLLFSFLSVILFRFYLISCRCHRSPGTRERINYV